MTIDVGQLFALAAEVLVGRFGHAVLHGLVALGHDDLLEEHRRPQVLAQFVVADSLRTQVVVGELANLSVSGGVLEVAQRRSSRT